MCSQPNKASVQRALSNLAGNIFEYYNVEMQRIEAQKEGLCNLAKQAMSFIAHAKRPLRVEELHQALRFWPGGNKLVESEHFAGKLLNVCCGLVRIDKQGQLEFVHYYFQEYCKAFPSKLINNSDSKIVEVCLTYLSQDEFASGLCGDNPSFQKRLDQNAFLSYAAQHWGDHIRDSRNDHTLSVLAYLEDHQKLASGIQALYAGTHISQTRFDQYPKNVSPLHMVSYWGLKSMITLHLQQGYESTVRNSYGETPLLLAARNDQAEAVKMFLDHGVDVDEQGSSRDTSLSWAARKGSEKLIHLLLSRGATLIVDSDGWSPINWAVLEGQPAALKLLLAHDFGITIDIDLKNQALFLAADEGRDEIARILLDSGADIDAQDDNGSTALDFAVAAGHETIVEDLLLREADVNSTDSGGNTALHWAVPRERIAKILLDDGASAFEQNDAGQTALHWAARDGSMAVARLLLLPGADVHIKDENGATPLHSAALQGHEQIVNLLLENGADRNAQDIDGWTPLYSAAVQEHDAIVSLLLDTSKDCRRVMEIVTERMEDTTKRTNLKQLAEKKSQGSTVLTGLRVAAQEGHSGRLQSMIDRGADVNAKDPAGYTALEIAAFQDYAQIVQILLDSGADVNLRGSLDCPPLHYAVEQGNIASIRLLLKYGADVNVDTYGTTPLMLAAKLGKQRIYRILLEANADTDARDCTGKTDASNFWTGDLFME